MESEEFVHTYLLKSDSKNIQSTVSNVIELLESICQTIAEQNQDLASRYKLLTFGSYRISGILESDLDVLLIASWPLDLLFRDLLGLLKRHNASDIRVRSHFHQVSIERIGYLSDLIDIRQSPMQESR